MGMQAYPPRGRTSHRSRSRSHSRSASRSGSRSRSRSSSRSHSRSRSRSRSRSGSSRSRSRSRSPGNNRGGYRQGYRPRPDQRGPYYPPTYQDQRTKEQGAEALAKAAEGARMAGVASGVPPTYSSGGSMQFMSSSNLQVTRHARRVYVGGLPLSLSELQLTAFMNHVMVAAGAATQPGSPVISVFMNMAKRFAFVEFRNVEEASNAMALDGIMCQGEVLKVRRPHDYNYAVARTLGPTEPNPNINIAALGVVSTQVEDGPNKIFVGGLPLFLNEDQVKELLLAFGPLKSFNLVTDRETGASKGFAFCEYADPDSTAGVVEGLTAILIAGRPLTVRLANAALAAPAHPKPSDRGGAPSLTPAQSAALAAAQQSWGMPAAISKDARLERSGLTTQPSAEAARGSPPPHKASMQDPSAGTESNDVSEGRLDGQAAGGGGGDGSGSQDKVVVRLANMVTREEVVDDEERAAVVEDTMEEVSKYGTLVSVTIPAPHPTDPSKDAPGVGLVFLRYQSPQGAERARLALDGRQFGDSLVQASFFDTAEFEAGRLR
ncbi:hypothetical protein V8C86DRAFT_2623885 [Haematococcus lacustris]